MHHPPRALLFLTLLLLPFNSSAAEARVPDATTPPGPPAAGERSFEVLNLEASHALKRKDYVAAEQLLKEASKKLDAQKATPAWINTELALSQSYNLLGMPEKAVAVAANAVEVCEARLGVEDPITINTISQYAVLLRRTGKPSEAEGEYRRYLGMLERKYGAESYLLALPLSRFGAFLHNSGRSKDALELHRRAERIVKRSTGGGVPSTCLVLTNLADCLLANDKVGEALEVMDRAAEIAAKTNDEELPWAGAVLRTQAEFFRKIRQFDRAEALAERAVRRLEKRPDFDRNKFFLLGSTQKTYQAVLRERGVDEDEIMRRLQNLATPAAP